MEYQINNDSLMHYGVLGMKWGVRNAETRAKYANQGKHPMTKRQAKKAIKQAKRSYRKSHGTWMTTGKNVASVDKKRESARKNDKQLNKIIKDRELAGLEADKIEARASKQGNKTALAKDHLTRLQTDPNATTKMRRQAEENYLKEKRKSENLSNLWDKKMNEYEKLDYAYGDRSREISKKFYEDYKTALVKDLNISDIEAGKQMLDDYGLTDKALRWKTSRGQ